MGTWGSLLALSNQALAEVDPLVMNLLVAQDIPQLQSLDIGRYVDIVDEWTRDLAQQIPAHESEFWKSPQDWGHDHALFKLGLISWYLDLVLGMAYREDQRELTSIKYTNPSDLFLNGLIDTLRGTCGNMAALYVAIAWRLGWPVSLACVGHHLYARYDDGQVMHNIEATNTGKGGFSTPPDQFYIEKYSLPKKAIQCGSDLKSLTPREMLGMFIGLRARHYDNTDARGDAEREYLIARSLFPNNRILYRGQMNLSVQLSIDRFEMQEEGAPESLLEWLQWFYPTRGGKTQKLQLQLNEAKHANTAETLLQAWNAK
jgi:hypothetical protein